MTFLLLLIQAAFGLVALACYVFVLLSMWQDSRPFAIACIALTFACGIGALIAYIYAWFNEQQMVALVWTISAAGAAAFYLMMVAAGLYAPG